jgi:hypothetical protein
MQSYVTLAGVVLDLAAISDDERGYLDRCVAAVRDGMDWTQFTLMVEGAESPLVQAAGGRVTQTVWDNPVFQVAYDLADRLGIAQGYLEGDYGTVTDRDRVSDERHPSSEAARR